VTRETISVVVSRHIAASPERVFDAWLDPGSAGKWLFATPGGVIERCEIDARVGGRFEVFERRGADLAEHFGEYREIDRPRKLSFDFWTSFSDERTLVSVGIAADGEGSLVTLSHHGVWEDYEERTRKGWTMILDGLARTLNGDSC
jgi:uncharacterized protein YndB with AHSA1/START domain